VKGSLDKTVNLWDAQTGRELATLKRARRLGLFSRLLPRRQDASFGEWGNDGQAAGGRCAGM